MPEPALRAARLSKRFGDTAALRDASFEVADGEILALLGPSGCGKTTTLRLLAGFERPDAGGVEIGGRAAVGANVFVPPERRRLGMVPQDYALFPHLSVGENVAFGLGGGVRVGVRRWLGRRDTPPRAQEMLELVGLADFGARYPHELSGGEAQRVALARALAPRPAAVLLDEPFSNLDQVLRGSLRVAMRGILKAADTAAVFVTHDREEALSLADRVAVMRGGRIEQIGTPGEIYHRPANRFVASFVGNANLLRGERRGDSAATDLGEIAIAAEGLDAPDGAALDVLLRPEQVILAHPPGSAQIDGRRLARVASSEYYGHDQIVRVTLPSGIELEARLHTDDVWSLGDEALVEIAADAVAFPHSD